MNIFEAPAVAEAPISEFNEAVNASRFVKGFGIAALVYSLLLFLGINLLASAIGIGTGLFIFRYDEGKFYRVLGVIVILLALIAPLPFLSPAVVAGGVLYKGSLVLGTLKRAPREDPDWNETRSRTIVGIVASAASLLVTLVIAILITIAIVVMVANNAR